MNRKGLLLVVSGPSGAGKGTMLSQLRERNENIRYSVSATTRKPREGEVHGLNYFFKSEAEFRRMIEANELVEWVIYCDHYYGTPRKYIEDMINQGRDVILEIEVVGAARIRDMFPECVMIFIAPPSMEELSHRLLKRGTETQDVVGKRLLQAESELRQIALYDYLVINDSVESAVTDLEAIVHAEKVRVTRNQDMVRGFLK